MSVELCLTWDDHHRTLIEVFETLLENSTLVDCTIAAEGQYLKAHKVVLSACSPYFEMLFTQESEKNPIVVLKDIKFQDLKALIDFIYRGKAQIPEDRLQDFTDAAESLQIKGLGGGHKKNTCENKARESPNVVRQESFAKMRSRTSCPRTEEITSVSSNANISNKNPRLENVSGSQLNNHSISLLPLSASGTLSPAATQHKVQKESSEARPSNAARSSVSPTVPPLQPVAEVYVPEAWIEPKTEVCMDEISIEGSDDCVEDTMIKDEVNNEEYENSTFPSPNEIVKEESGNSILMESVTETSNPDAALPAEELLSMQRYTTAASAPPSTRRACSVCGRTYASASDLVKHMRKHTGERPFACTHCGKAFTQRAYLKVHLRIHTGDRPFACTHCAKAFKQPAHLRDHLRIHTGERPFACTHCGKAFQQLANLKGHLHIHTGDRPFACTHCGKAFKQRASLKLHLRIHTGERPFACPRCAKAFNQRAHLQEHLRSHTGEWP